MQERFETFTVLINRISRSIRRIKMREMAEFGLNAAQVSCLYYLHTLSSPTATDLWQHCEEDKATVSRALVELEKGGYLLAREKGARRYKARLQLSEKGRFAAGRVSEKIDAVLEEVSRLLTEQERAAFYRSLSLISSSLQDLSEQSQSF